MTATAAQIARLRRMVSEPDDSNGYESYVLAEAIERFPLYDADGYEQGDDDWVATYDLAAAASDIWTEKAAARSERMDFGADGSTFSQSQQYAQALKMARYYNARRSPGSVRVFVESGPLVEEQEV